jgi:electron transfer flavoprotein alpha subunit
MLSDVLGMEQDADGLIFRRPMYAGNVIASVRIDGEGGVFSVRTSAFGAPTPADGESALQSVTIDDVALPRGTEWIGLEAGEQTRPDLTVASVVVSGGRPLRDAETFERLLGGLADKLGGAVGATRAAVDSGIAPNELQVGQTGKIVAPQLYIAAGVSGSVQHLAGMKDSKVIVAINTDPDAPIFEVADYGLVADLHEALPELISKL